MPPVAKIYHLTTPKLARICLTIMNILPQKHWIVLKYIVMIRCATFIQIKLCNIDTEHVSMYSILVKIGRVKIKHICTRHCAVLCLRAAFKFTTHLITVCSKETYLFLYQSLSLIFSLSKQFSYVHQWISNPQNRWIVIVNIYPSCIEHIVDMPACIGITYPLYHLRQKLL